MNITTAMISFSRWFFSELCRFAQAPRTVAPISLFFNRTGTMSKHKIQTNLYLIFTQLLWLIAPVTVFAGDNKIPQWYEITTGVLGIPVTIIGVAYSVILIKKTRLETKKTELEILEKQIQLRQALEAQPVEVQKLIVPAAENRIGLYLVLRFVLLYLILHAWGLIEDIYDLIFAGIVTGAQSSLNLELSGWAVIPLMVIQKIPKVAYWLVFFALAWPLFKEINSLLGLDIHELFRLSWKRKYEVSNDDG